MAAWRGGRARIWMTGAVTFLVAIPCALTGYVSQQNFDAQWISTQAKDGMNSVGIGSFFNVIELRSDVQLPRASCCRSRSSRSSSRHVLLVRKHGIVPPFQLSDRGAPQPGRARAAAQSPTPATARRAACHEPRERRRARTRRRSRVDGRATAPTTSSRRRRSRSAWCWPGARADDPVLVARRPPSTVKSWSRTDPVDFVTTATTELDGTSGTGDLRPALQPQLRRPAHRVHPPAEVARCAATRSTPPRTSCSRHCARSPASRRCRAPISTYQRGAAKHAGRAGRAPTRRRSARRRRPGRLDLRARR